jgi:hypothetical protein
MTKNIHISPNSNTIDFDSLYAKFRNINTPFAVGQSYTTHSSGITGEIKEIVPNPNGSYRIRLDVDGEEKWTTAVASN